MLTPNLASATPPAEPSSPAAVQHRLVSLMKQNSQLNDKVNRARIDLAAKQKAAAAATAAARAAAANFELARTAMSATIAAQYEGGSFSATGALLSSQSGQGYLDHLQTLSMLSTHAAQVAKNMSAAQHAADATSKQANTLLSQAKARSTTLAKQHTDLLKQVDKYNALLSRLTAPQRVAYQRTIAPSVSNASLTATRAGLLTSNAPGAAKKAVEFALAQVGKSYSWGAAGPDAYDCSGLTMASYASAGISLPHSAADQYNYGTEVSMDALQPGDLIFYYSPIGHVTIYVGGGMMVSASTEGVPISEMPVSAMSGVVGAKRIVG
ncbi:MAG TPA: NlpC/P60 family protein [Jatrophihabitantaceae bacterium]|nr:NlpC/P60 family protein [Jatrophihabitantaceae bacterium]